MHDEVAYKDRLDETNVEEGIQALVDSRTRPVSGPALRRLAASANSPAAEPTREDLAKMDTQSSDPSVETPRTPLLVERQTTHGNFEDNAIVSQAIKDLIRSGPGWSKLSAIERESMDMIALKFSRILSGKSMEKQHWEDVVGYAKLVEEKCF